MADSYTKRGPIRRNFSRIPEIAPLPNLIELQKKSYDAFFQKDIETDKRASVGLQGVFQSIFPIHDFSGKAQVEFCRYELEEPKYEIDESRQKGVTYASPLKVTFRLIVWDIDEETGIRSIRDIKEQDVYMGDMPLMTPNGTFVINGTERVVVSQMHRSPGVFFDHDRGRTHASGKYLFAARIIPYRGSWLDFEFDAKDLLYVRIDRKRKLPVTTLLTALDGVHTEARRLAQPDMPFYEAQGMSREEILSYFYDSAIYSWQDGQWKTDFSASLWKGVKLTQPLVNAETGQLAAETGTKLTARLIKKLEADGLRKILVSIEDLVGRYIAVDFINEETGEIFAEAGDEVSEELLDLLRFHGIVSVPILSIDHIVVGSYLRDTLLADKNTTREEALLDIYRVLRPGEPPTLESAEALFKSLFFDPERYDLSSVGRVKMNARLGLKTPDTVNILQKQDILEIVKMLLGLKDGRGDIDDIDSLSNRRVRSVGELLENQYRSGLLRMERTIRERMGAVDLETAMPNDLINAKPAAAVLREFFGTSQLSQFMDQTNPLSEINHKRRLSALGPGGVKKDRAVFEVRDVHPTHYGRICPVETPEGPNIGLINSLATYARINPYGFIETPYRRVVDQRVTDEVVYLSAIEEGRYTIAQANVELDEMGAFVQPVISCRRGGDYILASFEEIDFVDVSPKQIVSVAASLIPFVENDDANRALMGSNMQRQAVPLISADAPLVGTGMEAAVARDSGSVVLALRSGVVDQVDASRIVIRATEDLSPGMPVVDIYNLQKFRKSNANTCVNQKPIVCVGDLVKNGDIIADGSATQRGELALGRNVLVAFISWNGYCFEDSIIISEALVKDDVYTSIHIEEFEISARDTKLGNEEITRDIPGVGEETLRHLDEAGIAYIGAEVKPGDILAGKVTPKGENPMTPEEKLLRAIFGEKASDVRDTSLRLPPGISGTVVDVRVFSRRGVDKDERALSIERAEISRVSKDRDAERSILERNFYTMLAPLLINEKLVNNVDTLKAKQVLTEELLSNLPKHLWKQIVVASDECMQQVEALKEQHNKTLEALRKRFEQKVEKIRRGDELPTGVMKTVKIFVAVKRKLQPGDKMAGRHGNKGVVSRIVPVEDMPYFEDGTPVDIILNPLGLPSRMNVGQILETHLGWASIGLGRKVRECLESMAASNAKDTSSLRQFLGGLYERKEATEEVEAMTDEAIVEMASHMTRGVPMATPVFDGARETDIVHELEKAGLDASGQVVLYDGRTGEAFDRKITIGIIYMMKLHHLVDEKIHARSVGPYSLVTQQPLGGKAQFGGQRLGEMEVWALEAYGAAYTLQEMLTIKSDDVSGRTKVYEAIIRGDDNFESGVPESFNVLIKELKSLVLNVECSQQEA
ncbi:MAG: DNA-directed RNA polymerase subunit beta [Alphaproteobacteria bacterium]